MNTQIDRREPLLLRHAVPRIDQPEIPGHYSANADLWVIDTENGEQPIVEVAGRELAETQTKTSAQQEVDDNDFHADAALETSTVTKVRQEADDQDATLALPELRTKTAVQQEQDEPSIDVI